jgi:sulfite dehydrogenase (cytochrome) subunit A
MRRRSILTGAGALALGSRAARADDIPGLSTLLPEGTRATASLRSPTDKQGLIRLSDRPPNYETQLRHIRGVITPNDRFFVRYHLSELPKITSSYGWSLSIGGDAVDRPVQLSLADLDDLPQAEVVAVCQCAGNRRGYFQPHVPGVQWGDGAVGCATWHGPRLRDVLAKAGVKRTAVEVYLDGADGPPLPSTPDYRKSLPIAKALADETIVATMMNHAPLPFLNGLPARLVVPGWVGTYWMKHLNAIEVSSKPLESFWMQKAYRVPAGMFPVDMPFTTQNDAATWPITEMVVNAMITDPVEGNEVTRSGFQISGVAWDRGSGISRVEVTWDGGKSWWNALLGSSFGPFAFRTFTIQVPPVRPGPMVLSARATSNQGERQVTELKFNPAGYHNNVPRTLTVTAIQG